MNKIAKYNLTVRDEIMRRTRTTIHTTVVVTLRNGTQRTTTFNRIATDVEVLEDVIETALQAPEDAHVVGVHIFAGTTVEVWTQEKVRTRVYTVPAFLTRWECKPLHISGVLTGYRAERRGPFGHREYRPAYIGDIYKEGSFELARRLAERDAQACNEQEGI